MAGSGKRADQMKTFIIKKYGLQNYFGKHGFKRPQHSQEKYQTINVGDLNFEKEEINLQEKGYNKLLGKGKPNKNIFDRVGDYILLMKEDHAIKDNLMTEKGNRHKSMHGGLSEDEMFVPLIIITV
mgnify:CR=1 FL=1